MDGTEISASSGKDIPVLKGEGFTNILATKAAEKYHECGVFSPKLMQCLRECREQFEELADKYDRLEMID